MKTIISTGLATTLFSISLSVIAAPTQIPCPSAEAIKTSWEQLDTVSRFQKETNDFAVYSDEIAVTEGNIEWQVTTAQLNTRGFDDAFLKAQDMVKNVNLRVTENALDAGGLYVCEYRSNNTVVAAVAMKDEQHKTKFNFTSFSASLNKK